MSKRLKYGLAGIGFSLFFGIWCYFSILWAYDSLVVWKMPGRFGTGEIVLSISFFAMAFGFGVVSLISFASTILEIVGKPLKRGTMRKRVAKGAFVLGIVFAIAGAVTKEVMVILMGGRG
ncbi:MAG: hypothetical protein KGZ25_06220 [Planctomycetes bacterium]|nr:hypothetical protein [Planctomycetota bacterium]